MLTLRPYQQEAIDALNAFLCSSELNPCVVLPTGAGKSLVMASAIDGWKKQYPPFKCVVLAHRKELVEQNYGEFMGTAGDKLMFGWSVGVYSAGLGRKDEDADVIFAGIDSIWKRGGDFKFDCVIVDEAHRIPIRGEGKYREFIKLAKLANPNLRVVGFTATPFRLGSGPICHKDHILNEICYEANVGDLIRQGYLCNLRSKVSTEEPNLAGVKKSGGDYQQKSLGEAMRSGDLVARAVTDALRHLNAEGRRCVVWFCVDLKHVEAVANMLRAVGERAAVVTGNTPAAERDRLVGDFREGRYRHMCNVNVFTEGFNVKQVDGIVLLRPTLPKGMYAQMVGRGLRKHPDKTDCLILDYARCIETHGPIDCLEAGTVRVEVCQRCREVFSRGVRVCPHCGWEIPKQVIEEREAAERERKMHEEEASRLAILGTEPETLAVDDVIATRHSKLGSPDSMCVTYRCGMRTFREWICLDHPGYAGAKAQSWWRRRFWDGKGEPPTMTVDAALQDMFIGYAIRNVTKAITVVKRGKYFEITGYQLEVRGGMNAIDT